MAEVMLKETKFVLHHSALTRGIKELETDQLDVALQREINRALEFEDFEASIGLFRTKEKQTQLSVDDKFYYSLSLGRVRNGDYYKAIRMLDDVIQQKDRFYSEALWLQALLYLKINEPAKAKIILNKLISTSNYHYQITNIRMLLERLAES
jgi:tetratricopeptide (TPR) repeat protein